MIHQQYTKPSTGFILISVVVLQFILVDVSRGDDSQKLLNLLKKHQCLDCHQRDGFKEGIEKNDEKFKTEDPNLGEQGRVPPTLDGVGAKFNRVWLRQIIVQGTRSRPYMKPAMPKYSSEVADELVDLFIKVDSGKLPKVPEMAFPRNVNAKRFGRDLAGTDGLGCITCHTFKGKKPGAMGALDISLMGQRVTRDWFHQYMSNPQRFSPQTIMPAFWAGGQSPKPEILDGDPFQQIEALWLYLGEGYGAGAPRGIRWPRIEIKSASPNEAVMLRRSFPGVGKRGIGVGFPAKINFVFNAERLAMAMLWAGDFVDAAGVFASQGSGSARPLSRDVVRFPNNPNIAYLTSQSAEWPQWTERPAGYQFQGYSLNEAQYPTLKYSVQGTQIQDAFSDKSSAEIPTLVRKVRSKGLKDSGDLYFQVVATGDVEMLSPQKARIAKNLTIQIVSDHRFILVDKNQEELRVKISDESKPLEIHYSMEQ